jgi:ABC-2 type transport system ATP-binding protein
MEPIVSVSHLTHRYGERTALEDISFDVQPGEVFGLLGPNGAGKTTTIRLINGLFEPSAGSLRVLGLDPVTHGEQVRRQTGVLTETPALYERLTARQNLTFFATLAGVPRAERRARVQASLDQFELADRADDKAGAFSKGMKQRLALARAILHNPDLIFLDEPTAALDPEASLQVRDWIEKVSRQEGSTVVLCTHILSEAERLCSRVAVMGPGKLLAVGSLAELRQRVLPGLWVDVELQQPLAGGPECLRAVRGVLDVRAQDGNRLRVQVAEPAVIPQVAAEAVRQGGLLMRLQPEQISLEEVYFKLQGNHHALNGGVQ